MKKVVKNIRSWSIIIGISIGAFILSISILMFLLDLTNYGVSFAAISATIIMIFLYKDNNNLIGYKNLYLSYTFAIISGYLASFFGKDNKFISMAFLLTGIILMIIFKVFHSPAVAFAFSFIFVHFSIFTIIGIIISIFSLIFIAKTIKFMIRNHHQFKLRHTENKKIKFKFAKKKKPDYLVLKEKSSY